MLKSIELILISEINFLKTLFTEDHYDGGEEGLTACPASMRPFHPDIDYECECTVDSFNEKIANRIELLCGIGLKLQREEFKRGLIETLTETDVDLGKGIRCYAYTDKDFASMLGDLNA